MAAAAVIVLATLLKILLILVELPHVSWERIIDHSASSERLACSVGVSPTGVKVRPP